MFQIKSFALSLLSDCKYVQIPKKKYFFIWNNETQ